MTKQIFSEAVHTDIGYRQSFDIDTVLYKRKTPFQDLIIFHNKFWGDVLALDGIVQLTERDEFIYHEMIAHVPAFAHPNLKNVLVIGGGDGGVLRELLKHEKIEKIKLVEIDEEVINLSKKYLPKISDGAFDNKKVEVIITDGIKYVKDSQEKFDLIILDSTDPVGCGEVLFTDTFYKSCKAILNPGGLITAQSGVPFFQLEQLKQTMSSFSSIFNDWSIYSTAIPIFIGGVMAFAWGTDDINLRKTPLETINKRFLDSKISTKYYNPDIHLASFAIPEYVADNLALPKR